MGRGQAQSPTPRSTVRPGLLYLRAWRSGSWAGRVEIREREVRGMRMSFILTRRMWGLLRVFD
ncbi:MAG: hypothetical protein ACJAXZ_004649 [Akkermansiaceae bacterium]|jgi:hypothetical protein